jgi:hypothetical protein
LLLLLLCHHHTADCLVLLLLLLIAFVLHTMNRSRAGLMSTAKVHRSCTSSPSRYSGSGMDSAPSPAENAG